MFVRCTTQFFRVVKSSEKESRCFVIHISSCRSTLIHPTEVEQSSSPFARLEWAPHCCCNDVLATWGRWCSSASASSRSTGPWCRWWVCRGSLIRWSTTCSRTATAALSSHWCQRFQWSLDGDDIAFQKVHQSGSIWPEVSALVKTRNSIQPRHLVTPKSSLASCSPALV